MASKHGARSLLSSFTRTSPKTYNAQQRRGLVCMASSNGDSEREYDYDMFTIGAGSGGVRGSRFATGFGAKVAVAELPFATKASLTTGGVGGTCVLRGCVPKKLLVYGSEYSKEFEDCNGFGWDEFEKPQHDW